MIAILQILGTALAVTAMASRLTHKKQQVVESDNDPRLTNYDASLEIIKQCFGSYPHVISTNDVIEFNYNWGDDNCIDDLEQWDFRKSVFDEFKVGNKCPFTVTQMSSPSFMHGIKIKVHSPTQESTWRGIDDVRSSVLWVAEELAKEKVLRDQETV